MRNKPESDSSQQRKIIYAPPSLVEQIRRAEAAFAALSPEEQELRRQRNKEWFEDAKAYVRKAGLSHTGEGDLPILRSVVIDFRPGAAFSKCFRKDKSTNEKAR